MQSTFPTGEAQEHKKSSNFYGANFGRNQMSTEFFKNSDWFLKTDRFSYIKLKK